MIAGLRTAAEARADANLRILMSGFPDSMGMKVESLIKHLMGVQDRNPTALFINVPASEPIYVPTAAIAHIQTQLGYVITATPIAGKPPKYNGGIANWSRVTKVSWEI